MNDCQRCGMGIDKNGDGDCLMCHDYTDKQLLVMQRDNLRLLHEALQEKYIGVGSPGIEQIAKERRRQISAEGWSSEHDDTHVMGEMNRAAQCYAEVARRILKGNSEEYVVLAGESWPWDRSWFKPFSGGSARMDAILALKKAGALIAAEIDRVLRQQIIQISVISPKPPKKCEWVVSLDELVKMVEERGELEQIVYHSAPGYEEAVLMLTGDRKVSAIFAHAERGYLARGSVWRNYPFKMMRAAALRRAIEKAYPGLQDPRMLPMPLEQSTPAPPAFASPQSDLSTASESSGTPDEPGT